VRVERTKLAIATKVFLLFSCLSAHSHGHFIRTGACARVPRHCWTDLRGRALGEAGVGAAEAETTTRHSSAMSSSSSSRLSLPQSLLLLRRRAAATGKRSSTLELPLSTPWCTCAEILQRGRGSTGFSRKQNRKEKCSVLLVLRFSLLKVKKKKRQRRKLENVQLLRLRHADG